jgi:uncharacterized protein involved in cysteine biosynthesis
MLTVFGALLRALRDLTHPRIVAIMFVPMLGAIVLWVGLAWYFWGTWSGAAGTLFTDNAFARWLALYGFTWIVEGVSAIAIVALVIAATFVTAILITEFLAMPIVVSVVERQYTSLEKDQSASVIGSLANATAAIGIFALLWVVTLPLWLTGIGAIVLPAVLSAYVSQRLFRYDALAEHAGKDEYAAVVRGAKKRLYALGLILAVVYYIPFVNLIAPVLSGLAFTHLCLAELTQHRRRAVSPAQTR